MGDVVDLLGYRRHVAEDLDTGRFRVDLSPAEHREVMWGIADLLGVETVLEDIATSEATAARHEQIAERARIGAEVLREWLVSRGYAPGAS
jgi:hypothetical protein